MPDTLRDGKGRGFLAAINSDNQLLTRSTSVEQRLKSALDDNYFELTTGRISLTDANETAVVYLKNQNTSGKVLVIDRFFYDCWTSTGGSGADGILRYYKNPTSATGGTAIIPNITNYGSTITAVGTFLSGNTATPITLTGGTVWWSAYLTDKLSMALEEGRIVVPNGSSHAITVAAPAGNTSMFLSLNVAFYYFNPQLIGS